MEYKLESRNCIVCGSESKEVLHKRDPWTRARVIKTEDEMDMVHDTDVICTECGLVYKDPMMTEETMKEFYRSEYIKIYKEGSIEQISKTAIIESVIMNTYTLDFLNEIGYNLKGVKHLDVGSGMGGILKSFSSAGADSYGIEPCERHAEIVWKVYGKPVQVCDFESFYSDEKFDLITICNTLEHVYDPARFLEKAKGMLSEYGRILIEVPSSDYPYMATMVGGFYSAAHNFTWNESNMKHFLTKNGFNIEFYGPAGHKKCIFFMVEPGDVVTTPFKKPNIEELKEKALQCQNMEITAAQLSQELFRGSSVTTIEEKINKRYSYISNALRYVLANKCLEIGRIEDGLRLSQQPYQKAQSADFNYCQGSLEFTTAIGYRLLGDFKTAKEHLTKALESYPGIENHNYVKELYVDGIISESGFGGYPWFSCKKLAQTLN